MGSIERKLKRKQSNKVKKEAEKEMAAKVALFGKLPSCCLTCEKTFNKMDKEQVMTWSVVVRENEEKVNLYCPECWDSAKKLLEDYKERIKERKNARSN